MADTKETSRPVTLGELEATGPAGIAKVIIEKGFTRPELVADAMLNYLTELAETADPATRQALENGLATLDNALHPPSSSKKRVRRQK